MTSENAKKITDPLLITAQWLAALMLLMAIGLTIVFPQQAVEPVAGMRGAIIAFEFVQTPDEVAQVFGRIADDERTRRIAAMNFGNQLDYPFMLLYSLFFLCYALSLHVRHQAPALWIVCLLAPVMLAGDAMENYALLQIATAFEQGQDFSDALASLQFWTWVKWGALALALAIMVPFSAREGRFGWVLATCQAAAAGLGLVCYLERSWLNELFAFLVTLSLLLMAVQVLLWVYFPSTLKSQKVL